MTGLCRARVGALWPRALRIAAAFAFAAFAAVGTPAFAQQADLVVNQADNPDPGPAGGVFTYTIRVDNNGPDTAIGVNFADTLPPGSTFVGVRPRRARAIRPPRASSTARSAGSRISPTRRSRSR